MKSLIITVCSLFIAIGADAQSSAYADTQTEISSPLEAYWKQNQDRFKLYPTENIYNFLQLDTKTGKIDVVQWSLDEEKEFSVTLNGDDLSLLDAVSGTFELYPTKNIYQFILLDKVTGRKWHVQWGFEDSKRWIRKM